MVLVVGPYPKNGKHFQGTHANPWVRLPKKLKIEKLEPHGEINLNFKCKVALNASRIYVWRDREKTSATADTFRIKCETRQKRSFFSGAGGGSRTHMKLPSTDFESVASAIPPHQLNTKLFYHKNKNFSTTFKNFLKLSKISCKIDNF